MASTSAHVRPSASFVITGLVARALVFKHGSSAEYAALRRRVRPRLRWIESRNWRNMRKSGMVGSGEPYTSSIFALLLNASRCEI
jgi:hypothetical protein